MTEPNRRSRNPHQGVDLFLLDQLASRWGNAPGHYWFEMKLDARDGAGTLTL